MEQLLDIFINYQNVIIFTLALLIMQRIFRRIIQSLVELIRRELHAKSFREGATDFLKEFLDPQFARRLMAGALSDSLSSWRDGSFDGFPQCGRGSASALTSCWNLLSCVLSSQCCSEQARGDHVSARVSGCSGCSCRAGGQIGSAV